MRTDTESTPAPATHRFPSFLRVSLVLGMAGALAGCGEFFPLDIGGGGGGASGSASVTGMAAATDFSFETQQTAARFASSSSSTGELTIRICSADCQELGAATTAEGARVLTLRVNGLQTDIRSGRTFDIGRDASAEAELVSARGPSREQARGGQVFIDSTSAQDGGTTIGTFQLEFPSGTIKGFFESPVTGLAG